MNRKMCVYHKVSGYVTSVKTPFDYHWRGRLLISWLRQTVRLPKTVASRDVRAVDSIVFPLIHASVRPSTRPPIGLYDI